MLRVQCEHCKGWFSRKDVLVRHQRNVHGNMGLQPPAPPLQQAPLLSPFQSTSHGQSSVITDSFAFQHPFTANVSGPTSCGKTYFVKDLLHSCLISPQPQRIIWLYKRWQPLYDVMKDTVYPSVEFIQGIPIDLDQDSFINPNVRNLVILDDLMTSASKDPRINDLFTEGSHHRNLSIIAINQNLYFNKDPTQRRNCHYLVIFNNPVDQQQVMTLSRQMYPENPQHLMRHFRMATSRPYDYLLVDLKPTTPDHLRLRTKVIRGQQNVGDFQHSSDLADMQSKDSQSQHSSKRHEDFQSHHPRDLVSLPSCDDCGTVFINTHHLQNHVKSSCKRKRDENVDLPLAKKWIPFDDMDDSRDSDSSVYGKSDEQAVFDVIMDQARADNEKEWDVFYDGYLKEGMNRFEANKKSDQLMKAKDIQLFLKKYKTIITHILDLKHGSIHEKVMDDVKFFLDEGYDRQRSINLALNKNQYYFDEMYDCDYQNTHYESDDEDKQSTRSEHDESIED